MDTDVTLQRAKNKEKGGKERKIHHHVEWSITNYRNLQRIPLACALFRNHSRCRQIEYPRKIIFASFSLTQWLMRIVYQEKQYNSCFNH